MRKYLHVFIRAVIDMSGGGMHRTMSRGETSFLTLI